MKTATPSQLDRILEPESGNLVFLSLYKDRQDVLSYFNEVVMKCFNARRTWVRTCTF